MGFQRVNSRVNSSGHTEKDAGARLLCKKIYKKNRLK